MTIDLSNLPQTKQNLLNANPELLRSLEKEIPNQIQGANTRKAKERRGKSKLQRDLEDIDNRVEDAKRKADRLRLEYIVDFHLREISKKYQKHHLEKSESASRLVCPKCGEDDKGNKMNKQPWCMKCNTALIPASMLEKWRKIPEVKFAPNALRDELNRLNPGLRPDNKEER